MQNAVNKIAIMTFKVLHGNTPQYFVPVHVPRVAHFPGPYAGSWHQQSAGLSADKAFHIAILNFKIFHRSVTVDLPT